jgi:hypothetical protein
LKHNDQLFSVSKQILNYKHEVLVEVLMSMKSTGKQLFVRRKCQRFSLKSIKFNVAINFIHNRLPPFLYRLYNIRPARNGTRYRSFPTLCACSAGGKLMARHLDTVYIAGCDCTLATIKFRFKRVQNHNQAHLLLGHIIPNDSPSFEHRLT